MIGPRSPTRNPQEEGNPYVEITYNTVPGTGAVRHFRTRGGQRFGVLADRAGRRSLLIYDADDPHDADVPVQAIVMARDEADQLAEVLHSRSLPDRLADVERRLDELAVTAS